MKAKYYDGKYVKPYSIAVEFGEKEVFLKCEDFHADLQWNYSDLKILAKPELDQPLILVNAQNPNARLILEDNTPYAKLYSRLKTSNKPHFSISTAWYSLVLLFFFSITVIGGVFYSSDSIFRFISDHFPQSWERELGKMFTEEFVNGEKVCKNKKGLAALNKVVTELTKVSESGKSFTVRVVQNDNVNAFAALNNQIIIFSALLEESGSQEEFIGVLAHEMGYSIKRHSIQALVKYLGFGIITTILLSDLNTIHYANIFLQLKYSRDLEKEADEIAAQILYLSNIDKKGLVNFLEKVEQEEMEASKHFDFLSTLPASQKRIDFLKKC